MAVATSTIIAGIGLAAGVAGAAVQYRQGQKAAREQRNIARQQQQAQELEARRSRRQAIRQARMIRAQSQNVAAQVGGEGGSAIAGGMGAVASNLGSGLGFASAQTQLARGISRSSERALRYGAVSQLGGSVFQGLGGFSGILNNASTLYNSFNQPTQPQVG